MAPPAGIEEYRVCLAERSSPEWLRKLDEMRRLAPGFLDECAAALLAERPRVVGFATTFCQNLASLGLARRLKDADRAIRIVFGGSNCEGPMGAELQRSFPWIDVVVRGEGEAVVPDLFRALRAGEPPRPAPGLHCFFEDGRQVVIPNLDGTAVPMDVVPAPPTTTTTSPSSRPAASGAMRSAPRCSSPTRAPAAAGGARKRHLALHLLRLERRQHEVSLEERRPRPRGDRRPGAALPRAQHLHAVDDILDHAYFDELIPAITRLGLDSGALIYEVKANLKRSSFEALRAAGVRSIQPGIECCRRRSCG